MIAFFIPLFFFTCFCQNKYNVLEQFSTTGLSCTTRSNSIMSKYDQTGYTCLEDSSSRLYQYLSATSVVESDCTGACPLPCNDPSPLSRTYGNCFAGGLGSDERVTEKNTQTLDWVSMVTQYYANSNCSGEPEYVLISPSSCTGVIAASGSANCVTAQNPKPKASYTTKLEYCEGETAFTLPFEYTGGGDDDDSSNTNDVGFLVLTCIVFLCIFLSS